jgi:hypothetical protein
LKHSRTMAASQKDLSPRIAWAEAYCTVINRATA